jgi:propanol-preferring alcohol dehydrogenase
VTETPHSPGPAHEPAGAEKRRSQRIALRVPVVVIGTDVNGKAFGELTGTVIVNAHGALVELKAVLADNQRVLLRNRLTGQRESCRVVWFRRDESGMNRAGLEFLIPAPHFWGVEFPPETWKLEQMSAVVQREAGGPLEFAKVTRPRPLPEELLVRVEACGVCHSDLHVARGDWPEVAGAMSYPAILGHEVVGRVVEAGAAVKGYRGGERVGVGWLYSTCGRCELCREGAENICLKRQVTGIAAPGGFAEFIRVRAATAVPVPDSLPAEQAAPLFCAGLTVFHALRNAGLLSQAKIEGSAAGQRVAVIGLGGLGLLAVQLARLAGAEVCAVDVSDLKLALARSLGAAQTVDARSPDALQQIRGSSRPHLAVVTAPAKSAYDLAFRALRRRGTLAVVGLPKEDLTFFADDLAVSECRIIGSAVGTRAEMREVLELAAAGKLRCETQVCRPEEINNVIARMERGEIAGRAVLRFGPATP